jgi:phosphomannomutase/phosphoglucomutase
VVDAGNGATGKVAPALLAALGHEVIPLFCEIDGNFPNHHPDPAQPENTEDARRLMEERGADVAILFDGDGDRLGALLPGEPPIFADRMLMAFAQDLLQRRAGARVVFDVKCSANLPKWIAQHGGEPDMQPTGHAFIKARMKQTGAPLGGEMSGHFYLAENWRAVDDAPFAAARLLALLAANPNLFAQIPNSFASPELQVDMQGKDQHAFVERLRAAGGFADAKRIVSIDGVRAEYEDGFGLARASNTTPSLVLRFEANTPARLQEIQDVFRRALLAQDASLKLPF